MQPKPTDTRLFWSALLAGPVAWVVQLQGVYALSAWAAESGNSVALHLISLACLLCTVGGGSLAWRAWRAIGGWPSGAEAPTVGRSRHLAVVGVMAGVLFACVITASGQR